VWPGWIDVKVWETVLGDGDRSDVDGTMVAGIAEDLSGLLEVFIDIGACESTRDHAVAFASKIWKDANGSAAKRTINVTTWLRFERVAVSEEHEEKMKKKLKKMVASL
jgi:hypothetical protein